MSTLAKIKKVLLMFSEPRVILNIVLTRMLVFLPDKIYLKIWFRNQMGYWMNFKNPKTFNEKLQWLKLYYRKPVMTTLVDKDAVKNYVADRIGTEFIIPTLGVWDTFDEIEFDKLPNQFVLKCTHDSGGLIICKDKCKFDRASARMKINKSLATDFYKLGREWPYKNVPRRIIAEKYMVDSKTKELRDYKFFCFNGVVHFFKIDFDRQSSHRANYYNKLGELLEFGETMCPPDFARDIKMPVNLNKMISLAEKLSKDYPFLRVDFYEIDEQVFFGELTFFPSAGIGRFIPEKWDARLGDKIILPN